MDKKCVDQYVAWVNIHQRIISFCEQKNYEAIQFQVKDHFMNYLLEMQVKGYRFQ